MDEEKKELKPEDPEVIQEEVRKTQTDLAGKIYPGNSYRSREEEKKEKEESGKKKPVAHGISVKKRRGLKERITDLIFEPEGSDGYDYVYEEFIRPAALDMAWDVSHNILDAIQDTISGALFGDSGRRMRRRSGYYRSSDYDDYGEYWNRERRSRRRRSEREREEDDDRRRSRRSTDVAAKVETRSEAVDLVKAMQDQVHDFKVASVLNFYDFADMPTKSSDDNWGWDLGHPFEATITRVRDGYIVEPCAPIWLDR